MTQSEFIAEMNRMFEAFPDWRKQFPDAKLRLVFSKVSRMTPRWMEATVDDMIGNFGLAPKLKDFEKRLEETKEEQMTLPEQQIFFLPRGHNCERCDNSGYVLRTAPNGYRYTFRCECSAGTRREETLRGPQRMDGTREEVYLPRVSEADKYFNRMHEKPLDFSQAVRQNDSTGESEREGQ